MNNNPYFMSLLIGILVFIVMSLYKKSKNEDVNRTECFKMSAIFSLLSFGALQVYDKKPSPIMTEPFISSLEP